MILASRPGYVSLRADGPEAHRAFAGESGGIRWQHVPATERRGRVHTSTITVAVLPEPSPARVHIDPGDLRWALCRGSGSGGQKRNVTDSAVQLTHLPSGIQVRAETERSQRRNRELAMGVLRARLLAREQDRQIRSRNALRRELAGRGERADKRRTVAEQRGTVVDHRTGRKTSTRRYLKGFLEDLMD